MSSKPTDDLPAAPHPNAPGKPGGSHAADDALPPVQPPSASFLLQLFFIPLIIVLGIVAVWGMFSWLAHMGSDPRDLVKDLKAMNDASWQRAYQLSEHLRNPEYADLKKDTELANDLTELLSQHLAITDKRRTDQAHVNMRIYLCRALGEFELGFVAAILAEAATTERDAADTEVRRSAIEGLATLAGNIGSEAMQNQASAMDALFKASQERGGENAAERDAIRSTAAYALGVVGGPEATERLHQLLLDSNANVRFNAATGLARHGDVRCLPVLIDMLDPESDVGIEEDLEEGLQKRQKLAILTNAIFAASRMVDAPAQEDLRSLEDALTKLIDSDMPRAIRVKAKEARIVLQRRD